jgi:hypothetical protein
MVRNRKEGRKESGHVHMEESRAWDAKQGGEEDPI